ncbi:MAG: N-acetylmuramic acid 6-phosphate etherase [bacterium]|nr:N-acetylmuramic acid 6-phosphate etherase [bacterium]
MDTEDRDLRYEDIDLWPTGSIVRAIGEANAAASAAVLMASDEIAAAVDAMTSRFAVESRLIGIAAGTPRRLLETGVFPEINATYGLPLSQMVTLGAGGIAALTVPMEGAEDDEAAAVRGVLELKVGRNDIVIAVSASGTTPFVCYGLYTANACGALTVGVGNNLKSPLLMNAQYPIYLATGAEPVAGSTMMKAGMAQRGTLVNLLVSLMIRQGGVYKGRMFGVAAKCAKIDRRKMGMVAETDGATANYDAARKALEESGDPKTALLMLRGISIDEARRILAFCKGNLRTVDTFLKVDSSTRIRMMHRAELEKAVAKK